MLIIAQELGARVHRTGLQTPKGYFQREWLPQTLQVPKVQAGLGKTTFPDDPDGDRGVWPMGYIKLHHGWSKYIFLVKLWIFSGWGRAADLPLAISIG